MVFNSESETGCVQAVTVRLNCCVNVRTLRVGRRLLTGDDRECSSAAIDAFYVTCSATLSQKTDCPAWQYIADFVTRGVALHPCRRDKASMISRAVCLLRCQLRQLRSLANTSGRLACPETRRQMRSACLSRSAQSLDSGPAHDILFLAARGKCSSFDCLPG